MLGDMFPHLGHGITDCDVVVEELAVSSSIPVGEGRELLRDGVEESDNNTNGCCFHIRAEFIDSGRIRNTIMAIELHLFPDSEKNGRQHEDGRPVLETVATVNTGV